MDSKEKGLGEKKFPISCDFSLVLRIGFVELEKLFRNFCQEKLAGNLPAKQLVVLIPIRRM